MQGTQTGVDTCLHLYWYQMSPEPDEEIHLCLRILGIAHPEHTLLTEGQRGTQEFLPHHMLGYVTIP